MGNEQAGNGPAEVIVLSDYIYQLANTVLELTCSNVRGDIEAAVMAELYAGTKTLPGSTRLNFAQDVLCRIRS